MRYLLCSLFFIHSVFAQEVSYKEAWQSLGPNEKPDSPTKISACGIGPVEFVRVFKQDPNHLLAGSLSGGLFVSEDGGENWINSGSDHWLYSGCGWADFYPENSKIWFAYSNLSDNNGKPGRIGQYGGVMRTMDGGLTWQRIGTSNELFNNEGIAIYGFRFLPSDPKTLFVLSEDGLFYTRNCLSDQVSWEKVTAFDGMIYDMDFMGDHAFVSVFQHGKWNVYSYDFYQNSAKKNETIEQMEDPMRTITFEPRDTNLLILVDFSKKNDELWEYEINNGNTVKLLSSLQVNFGSGHTFAVNPHNSNEFLIGNSITLKKWNYTNLREKKLGGGYHVDVEFVAYDPIDSNKIYMACHGGIYISTDQGLSWQDKSNGLGVAEVMGLDVSETDPDQLVIGVFHDGSSVLADFEKNGIYTWRTVNGGDALLPLIDPYDPAIVYTSTQFRGGGIYHSTDTSKTINNIHHLNQLTSAGWEHAAILHPDQKNVLFYNFSRKENPSNVDVVRSLSPGEKNSSLPVSNFKESHGLESYKVYGLFVNPYFPDHLYAYVLHFDKDQDGKGVTRHRLFRTESSLADTAAIISSWYELEVPLSSWIGDVQCDPNNPNQLYISYVGAQDTRSNPTLTTGLIYAVTYSKKKNSIKKSMDISQNLPNGIAGRFNLEFMNPDSKEILIATRNGVYLGTKKTLKGKENWTEIGYGLPHCKIYGLKYHETSKTITVGLFGRGVWRYYVE